MRRRVKEPITSSRSSMAQIPLTPRAVSNRLARERLNDSVQTSRNRFGRKIAARGVKNLREQRRAAAFSFSRNLRHGNGVGRGGDEQAWVYGYWLGRKYLSPDVHLSGRAQNCAFFL